MARRLVVQSARTSTPSRDQNALALGVQLISGLLPGRDQPLGAGESRAARVEGLVLLAAGRAEGVERSARDPAIHGEIAGRVHRASKQLGAEIALAMPKERDPHALGAVFLLEIGASAWLRLELPDNAVHQPANGQGTRPCDGCP